MDGTGQSAAASSAVPRVKRTAIANAVAIPRSSVRIKLVISVSPLPISVRVLTDVDRARFSAPEPSLATGRSFNGRDVARVARREGMGSRRRRTGSTPFSPADCPGAGLRCGNRCGMAREREVRERRGLERLLDARHVRAMRPPGSHAPARLLDVHPRPFHERRVRAFLLTQVASAGLTAPDASNTAKAPTRNQIMDAPPTCLSQVGQSGSRIGGYLKNVKGM